MLNYKVYLLLYTIVAFYFIIITVYTVVPTTLIIIIFIHTRPRAATLLYRYTQPPPPNSTLPVAFTIAQQTDMLIHIYIVRVLWWCNIIAGDPATMKIKRKSGHRARVGGERNTVGAVTGGVVVGYKGFKLPDINHALPAKSDTPSQSFASERGSD